MSDTKLLNFQRMSVRRPYLRIKSPAELEGDVRQEPGLKRRRSAASLTVLCPVCGGPAPDHLHFGGDQQLTTTGAKKRIKKKKDTA